MCVGLEPLGPKPDVPSPILLFSKGIRRTRQVCRVHQSISQSTFRRCYFSDIAIPIQRGGIQYFQLELQPEPMEGFLSIATILCVARRWSWTCCSWTARRNPNESGFNPKRRIQTIGANFRFEFISVGIESAGRCECWRHGDVAGWICVARTCRVWTGVRERVVTVSSDYHVAVEVAEKHSIAVQQSSVARSGAFAL